MTKTEFFHNILRVHNNRIKSDNACYYYLYRRGHKTQKNEADNSFTKNVAKKHNYHPTYKKCAGWYDFLNNMNIPFDFLYDRIILHFDKLVIKQNNHVIRDVYVAFRPIIRPCDSINSMYLSICRTTFTIKEFANRYCHPHVRFEEDLTSHTSICMGTTPFKIGMSVDYNFYQFVIYIKSFLEHEYSNPYIATSTIKNNDRSNFEISFNRVNRSIDWSKIQYEVANINKYQIIQPKVDNSEIEYYKTVFGDSIIAIETEDGPVEVVKAKELLCKADLIYDFRFHGKEITRKIIYNDSEEIINPIWKQQFQRLCSGYLTRLFLEASNNNFRECTETSGVLVQENS